MKYGSNDNHQQKSSISDWKYLYRVFPHFRNRLLGTLDDCVLTVKTFKRDVEVKFSLLNSPIAFVSSAEKEARRAKRSKITRFSKKSARRLRHIIRNSEDLWKAFITLTYPESYPLDGKKAKSHLNSFLQYLRRRNIQYVWVLEFQNRGAPHFHVLISDYIDKNELSERWYEIVRSGDTKHLLAGTRIESIKSKKHLYGYLSSYINKLLQKAVPSAYLNVGRFWGASRNLLAFVVYQVIGQYYKLSRVIRLLRRWYKARLKLFGIKWRWRGQGFIVTDGMQFMNALYALKLKTET